MTNLNELIKDTIEVQAKMMVYKNEVHNRINLLNKEIKQYVEDILRKKFPEHTFYALTDQSAGCMTDNWKPSVTIMSVNDLTLTNFDYWIDRNKKMKDTPIDLSEFTNYLLELESELGIPFKLHKEKVKVRDDIKVIKSEEDLKLKYENIDILHKGEVWFKGWDIADIFFITMYENEYVLFYSRNGHGFGIDNIVRKEHGEEWLHNFFDYITEDKDNEHVKEKYYKLILNHWRKK